MWHLPRLSLMRDVLPFTVPNLIVSIADITGSNWLLNNALENAAVYGEGLSITFAEGEAARSKARGKEIESRSHHVRRYDRLRRHYPSIPH